LIIRLLRPEKVLNFDHVRSDPATARLALVVG
jgi:hypothetical protein